VDVARQHRILIASDECYQELWFDRPAPSILEACDNDYTGVLAFVSLSKRSGMTGYRSGAILGDPQLIATLRRLRVNIGTASPTFIQAAATAAWRDQDHVDERRRIFAAKRDIVLGFLRDEGFRVAHSDGTFYLWVQAPGGDDVGYANALQRIHVLVTPGRAFGPAGTGWFRIALVPTVDECRRAVERWRVAIRNAALPGT
ncbi:MAG: aminotransferase class I/II-fold pyridoxal phosphate-dependent enzyme, partial [Nitriliruptoraceae bacterium]